MTQRYLKYEAYNNLDYSVTIPASRILFILKLPALIWFFGLKDFLRGHEGDNVRIDRWFCLKNVWPQILVAYKIRDTGVYGWKRLK